MIPSNDLVGRIVISSAGRDQGQIYVVIGIKQPRFVLLADGENRGVNNPKNKNIRHIRLTDSVACDVVQKIKNGSIISNDSIRHAIRLYKSDNL